MKKFFSELKEFAIRGSVVDLAVGVVIGSAFGKIVSSLVSDVIMPPLGFLTGGVRLTDIVWQLSPNSTLTIGNFLQACVDFAIIAIAIFMLIKVMNKLHRKEIREEITVPSKEAELLTEIRDLLKQRN